MCLSLLQDRTEVFKTFRDTHAGVLLCTVSSREYLSIICSHHRRAALIVSLGSERCSQCLRVNANDAVEAKRVIFFQILLSEFRFGVLKLIFSTS
jgi:hypothetical protein